MRIRNRAAGQASPVIGMADTVPEVDARFCQQAADLPIRGRRAAGPSSTLSSS